MKQVTVFLWNYIFDHKVSPLRHIPDITVRHLILQILGWMWGIAFSLSLGSYFVFGVTLVGHSLLIAAAAITVATYTAAAKSPDVFTHALGRRSDGEHI